MENTLTTLQKICLVTAVEKRNHHITLKSLLCWAYSNNHNNNTNNIKKNFYFNKFSATWLPKPSLNNRYTTGRESIKANLTPFASSWLSPFFNHQLFREFPLTKRLKKARTSSFKNLHSQKVKNFDAITRQLESKAFCKKIKIASYQTNLSRFPNFKGNLTWTQR